MSEKRTCAFCETKEPERGQKYCPDCKRLADDALDEIFGGPGEMDKFLERHLGPLMRKPR